MRIQRDGLSFQRKKILRFTFAGQENCNCVFDVNVLENN